ncbi:MAG: flagellar assembly protein FliW [Candidatus Eremiobacterota bacterium]
MKTTVCVNCRDVFRMLHPVPGFEDCRTWALVAREEHLPFLWLQAVERPEVALPVVDPEVFFPEYRPRLPAWLDRGDWALFCVVSRRCEGLGLNLAAPFALCRTSRNGTQVVLDDPRYTVFHPLRRDGPRA